VACMPLCLGVPTLMAPGTKAANASCGDAMAHTVGIGCAWSLCHTAGPDLDLAGK
jgi:hypothetical protein